jgi:hypothetical protein
MYGTTEIKFRRTLYSLFLSSLALHVSGAIYTHHQERTCSVQPAIGVCVWFWCVIPLEQVLVGTPLH